MAFLRFHLHGRCSGRFSTKVRRRSCARNLTNLMVHHGDHSSVKQSLAADTPAVIIPTMTERESNARRLVALGAGEIVMPVDTTDGEKQIDLATFAAAVQRVLADPTYRDSARRVAKSMRTYGGAPGAVRCACRIKLSGRRTCL